MTAQHSQHQKNLLESPMGATALYSLGLQGWESLVMKSKLSHCPKRKPEYKAIDQGYGWFSKMFEKNYRVVYENLLTNTLILTSNVLTDFSFSKLLLSQSTLDSMSERTHIYYLVGLKFPWTHIHSSALNLWLRAESHSLPFLVSRGH